MNILAEQRRRRFGVWLRTGRWLRPDDGCGLEVKFNPWHDPGDGRFTFSGAGRYYGQDGVARSAGRSQHVPQVEYVIDTRLPPMSTRADIEAWRTEQLAKFGHRPEYRRAIEAQYRRYLRDLANAPVNGAQANGAADGSDDQSRMSETHPPASRQSAPENANERQAVSPKSQVRDRGGSRGGGGLTGVARGSGGGRPSAHGNWPSYSAPRNQPTQIRRPDDRGGFPGGGGDFGGGGTSGSWDEPAESQTRQKDRTQGGGAFAGGAGSFGGAGATGSWDVPPPRPLRKQRQQAGAVHSPPAVRWRPISRNGYLYEIDDQNRTRRVSGEITLNPGQGRSKKVQREAGGNDRRKSDQGGHYIARRFNGPTEAFNHFAQDRNFNQSRYRMLEEQWATAKRAGKNVAVNIVPHYREGSSRPFEIDVRYKIDGREHSVKLPNEPSEKRNDK